jgi:hypothetical protein
MGAVADLFDRNGSGLIDWEEFIAALRPDWVSHMTIFLIWLRTVYALSHNEV